MKVTWCPPSLGPVPGILFKLPALDVGCGTGIVTRQVAERLGSRGTVTGLDLNPNMLAVARSVANRQGCQLTGVKGMRNNSIFLAAALILCYASSR
jgi:2-polyprenyl-3-methyl-5-hydroxy-6-metoxy-1,4-benzoquinol methylase